MYLKFCFGGGGGQVGILVSELNLFEKGGKRKTSAVNTQHTILVFFFLPLTFVFFPYFLVLRRGHLFD